MTKFVEEIRVDNLKRLVLEHKTVHAVAETLGKDDSQVSQWLNRSTNSGTGKPRNISARSARAIEVAFFKPVGWMDEPEELALQSHQEAMTEPTPFKVAELSALEVGLLVKFRLASESLRDSMIEAIERIYAGQSPAWQQSTTAILPDRKTQKE